MKRVAVVIVCSELVEPRLRGQLLAVSRPDPPLRYGFPGGGVEPGESFEQGARRELWEETGLVAARLIPVFEAHTSPDYVVRCFLETGLPAGHVRSSQEGLARWLPPWMLAQRSTGAFPEYARAALARAAQAA